jgi:hypothetical protein
MTVYKLMIIEIEKWNVASIWISKLKSIIWILHQIDGYDVRKQLSAHNVTYLMPNAFWMKNYPIWLHRKNRSSFRSRLVKRKTCCSHQSWYWKPLDASITEQVTKKRQLQSTRCLAKGEDWMSIRLYKNINLFIRWQFNISKNLIERVHYYSFMCHASSTTPTFTVSLRYQSSSFLFFS